METTGTCVREYGSVSGEEGERLDEIKNVTLGIRTHAITANFYHVIVHRCLILEQWLYHKYIGIWYSHSVM
jgi:hypothetical protein